MIREMPNFEIAFGVRDFGGGSSAAQPAGKDCNSGGGLCLCAAPRSVKRSPGVSVARVAQRYAMNANLISKWLRDAPYAPELPAEPDAGCFLPVEIVGRPTRDDSRAAADPGRWPRP